MMTRFSSSSSTHRRRRRRRRRPKGESFFLRFDESSFFFNIIIVPFLLMMGKYHRVVSGLTAIPSENWHDFVAECLNESGAEVTGKCTTWASGNDYGTMRNWDVSLVEDMNGWDNTAEVSCFGLGCKWTFNGDISQWNIGGGDEYGINVL